MPSEQRCIFCLEKGNSRTGGLICKHVVDGFVHSKCFRHYLLYSNRTFCPICRRSLPIKDIMILAETKNEELLMQSLIEEDEDSFIRAVETHLVITSYPDDVLKLAFVSAASFGFTKAGKKFYEQIFPRQSMFKRFIQRFKKQEQVKYYLSHFTENGILKAVLKLKFRVFERFSYGSDIRPIALFCSVIDQNMAMLKLVLGFKNIDVNYRDIDCYSPLYYSIAKNNLEATKLLLEHKARITNVHPRYNALIFAIILERKEHSRLLRCYL